MSAHSNDPLNLPPWLRPTLGPIPRDEPVTKAPRATPLPDWLSTNPKELPTPVTQEGKALLFRQFEIAFPRLMEMVCEGYTIGKAIAALPEPIDHGAFMRWLKKKPDLYEIFKEAKEVRTEEWADRIIRHAEGSDEGFLNDTPRSKLIVDTYWKLMAADNRKQYGDTKSIEINQSISITSALEQAEARTKAAILNNDDVDLLDSEDTLFLPAPGNDPDEDDDG